ncbi:helicase, putative [Eimeria tenella]|uniref:Helicase, putative n=1 Tax=Eimeria tenella TaxID=5802 RepID=U6L6B0_EIMTE|nr:helicase, putative [Eimeria tenella]CDJ43340.1 helicase, putative [Eimeria tenella]|eukprot:XP_013234090.1 helicase, putative [Eimeria tenella]
MQYPSITSLHEAQCNMEASVHQQTGDTLSASSSSTPELAVEDGTFGFPYSPYPSQIVFMATLWGALQGCSKQTKLAALEMPTGGGKTLSFLCPAVLWLKRNEEELLLQQLQQAQQQQQTCQVPRRKAPPWIKTALQQQQKLRVRQFLADREDYLKRAASWADSAAAANTPQQAQHHGHWDCQIGIRRKRPAATTDKQSQQQKEADFDDPTPDESPPSVRLEASNAYKEQWGAPNRGYTENLQKPQIVICSRTHHQLQQYVDEIRLMQKQGKVEDVKRFVAVVAAGRRQLCIHPDVCSSGNSSTSNSCSSDMGDKCSYLVSKGLCSYYKRRNFVADAAVSSVLDIEDLRRIGRKVGGCPYYGCRAASPAADVLLLPFSLAFPAQGEAAETGLVALTNAVFCIDEAHHLAAALRSSKAAAISHGSAASAARLLNLYVDYYGNRLAPRSFHLLQQLARFAENIHKGLQPFCCCGQKQHRQPQWQEQQRGKVDLKEAGVELLGDPPQPSTMPVAGIELGASDTRAAERASTVLTATSLLRRLKLDGFDLHELVAFLCDSNIRICQKIRGFAVQQNHTQQQRQLENRQKCQQMQQRKNQPHVQQQIMEPSCMYTLKNLLCALLAMDVADRLVISNLHETVASAASPGVAAYQSATAAAATTSDSGSRCCCSKLEVVCLATEKVFEPIIKASRLVVLMGGTLSPFASLSRFVRCLSPSQYLFFSADSVAAKERVLALAVPRLSLDQSPMCFEYSQRMQFPSQFIALLRLLLSVSGTVPGGIVVFFPSFAMLQSFVAVADAGGSAAASTAPSIVEELRRRGPLLVEKRMPGATKFKAGFYMAYGAILWKLYKSAVLGKGTTPEFRQDSTDCTKQLDQMSDEEGGKGYPWQQCATGLAEPKEKPLRPKTAFLFCVMGGRLSEGVNFSDALARLLVIVGLPFPSTQDTIFRLQEKYYDEIMMRQHVTSAGAQEARQDSPSEFIGANKQADLHREQQQTQKHVEYGLLQCMITVNQTIGRAIRHSRDYAAVLLVDRRYALPRIQELLPRWVVQSLDTVNPVSQDQELPLPPFKSVRSAEKGTTDVIQQRLKVFFEPLEKTLFAKLPT